MKLTGTWVGQYTYGQSYDQLAATSVPFTMSLTESWRLRVVGYVRDDASRGGQPERGRIVGQRKGRQLEFLKTMPKGYVTDADGNMVEQRQFLEEEFGIALPDGMPPHRIHYAGTLDEHGQSVAGTWRIVPWGRTADGRELGSGNGSWSARRMSDQPSAV
ncbi:MAG: hypothetical protein KDC98_05850 [Planctomycetes bacterium]|nr:hypothetical protein [Planctomycetota bacterium]